MLTSSSLLWRSWLQPRTASRLSFHINSDRRAKDNCHCGGSSRHITCELDGSSKLLGTESVGMFPPFSQVGGSATAAAVQTAQNLSSECRTAPQHHPSAYRDVGETDGRRITCKCKIGQARGRVFAPRGGVNLASRADLYNAITLCWPCFLYCHGLNCTFKTCHMISNKCGKPSWSHTWNAVASLLNEPCSKCLTS